LEPGMVPSVSGPTACAIGASPKQASSSRMRNPALTGLIGFLTGGVVVLNRINGFIGLVIFLPLFSRGLVWM
jgi:energy-coupling factor transporter transmembrane protein EcfT